MEKTKFSNSSEKAKTDFEKLIDRLNTAVDATKDYSLNIDRKIDLLKSNTIGKILKEKEIQEPIPDGIIGKITELIIMLEDINNDTLSITVDKLNYII